jgi:hypothetical protein
MRTSARKRPLSAGQVAALLLLVATLMMWWSARGVEENCTVYGASPQFQSLSNIGQAPIGCVR